MNCLSFFCGAELKTVLPENEIVFAVQTFHLYPMCVQEHGKSEQVKITKCTILIVQRKISEY